MMALQSVKVVQLQGVLLFRYAPRSLQGCQAMLTSSLDECFLGSGVNAAEDIRVGLVRA